MARSTGTRLQAVGEDETVVGDEIANGARATSSAEGFLTSLLLMNLRSLGQRAIAALGNLVGLAFVGSVFWLALLIAGSPSVFQLIELTLYGAFILMALRFLR